LTLLLLGFNPNFKVIFLIISIIFLGNCAPLQQQYGTGPIKLLPYVQQQFEKYKALDQPEFFAVSSDGYFSGYSHCRSGVCNDWEYGVRIAIISCERRADTPCKIYAKGREIVWNKN
jgi:hypothetical protein